MRLHGERELCVQSEPEEMQAVAYLTHEPFVGMKGLDHV